MLSREDLAALDMKPEPHLPPLKDYFWSTLKVKIVVLIVPERLLAVLKDVWLFLWNLDLFVLFLSWPVHSPLVLEWLRSFLMARVLQVWLEDIGFPAAVGDGRPRGLCCCHPSEDLGSDCEPPLEEEQNLASVYAEPPGTLSLRSSGLNLPLLCFVVFVYIHLAK